MSPQDLFILESGTAEACFSLGVWFMENGRYAEAETCFRRTLSLAPTSVETVLNLGYALDKQGRCVEAFACYESVLATTPDNANASYNRAAHLLRGGDLVNQLSPESIAAEASVEMLEASFQQALASLEKEDPVTAIPELLDLLKYLPDESAVWFNLGRAYDMAGRLGEAEQAYRQALAENPKSAAIWCAMGEIRLKQKAYAEAEVFFRKAHELKPESVEILLSLGSALTVQHKTAEALNCCQTILSINPDCVEAVYNMAFIQLRNGNFRQGFANFEARLAIKKFNIDPRTYLQPRWDGSPLNGKSILIYGEQGMGDVIQFARYVPLIAQIGGRVVLEIDPPLIPLFDKFPGVDLIVPSSPTPPLTDVYIQLLSLPYLFGTLLETVPNQIPYLVPDQSKVSAWRQRLSNQVFQIGLAWRGNPKNPRDEVRSCALSRFAPLAGLPDVMFYSLQVGSAAAEAASAPEGMNLADCSFLLTDLTETAALISNLDLVISVDTAVAHLAGAMGQQVWVLLPEGSEWRWLEGRCDTPWYPTMRVFEHETDSDWDGMINRIRIALEKLLSEINISDDIESRYNYGVSLKEAGDLKGAEAFFRQIVEQHPELPDPLHSLGVVLQLQARLPEAISCYRAAITLDPGFVRAHYNLANAFLRSGLYQEAIESVKSTIQLDPSHADAHWLLGMLLLQSGDFQNGWREYEWRWKARAFTCRMPELGCPQWDGSLLQGRTLLIHMEQGRGDMIQFIRYAPLVAAMGGNVVACAAPELVSLLTTVEGLGVVVDNGGELPDYDLHIPVQSLPYVFGTTLETIPCRIPYLRPDPFKVEAWRQKIVYDKRLRIGLIWQGTPDHIDDRNRSCPLQELRPLLSLEEFNFFSLQVGAGSEQLDACSSESSIVDLTDSIRDFSDTAALMAHLDLVISVDTAGAHLAGALGKPVWLLLPYIAEWRWMLEREDSPWYPGMRLFRQTSPGNWCALIEYVRQELLQLPSLADYHAQRGLELLKSGFTDEAEQAFSRSVQLNSGSAEIHCNRGVSLDAMGRYDEALGCYREALSIKSDFITALYNMGNAHSALKDLEAAQACYQRIVELNPNFVPAYLALGEIDKQQSSFARGLAHFQQAISLDSGCADAWQGMAEIYQAQEDFEQAISAYNQVLLLDAGKANVWNLLGTVFHSIEQLDEAEVCYQRALALLPECTTVLNNLGVVLSAQGRLEDAIVIYHRLLNVDNSYAEGHWNLAVALLAKGDYQEGWREYEWRFRKTNPVAKREFPQSLWDGSELKGRSLLLHAEQGFGDTIQFVRYAMILAQRGERIIIECQVPGLKRLLKSLEGIAEIVVAGESLPPFDCHLPLMSLPLIFETNLETIPAQIPYLAADPLDVGVWQQRMASATGFRVGLVWFAKQSQVLNRKRSCRLEMFAPLWGVPGVDFFTLQVGLGSEQLTEYGAHFPINDLTGHISDFADTAAFIANLDLVITIDTVIAHLAGALGARTWVVLPHVAEWRWLSQRKDSPWYPGMRLFRQPGAGDWPGLMASVAEALNEYVQPEMESEERPLIQSELRVGLAWSGRQDNPLNRKRSCPFATLAPLLDLPGITFFSLQLGSDTKDGLDARLIDLTDGIHNFEDTAALMVNLDLIISIDTSVAHLAAAVGRPTWVLLSHVADWRWLKNRSDSPWYPGIELFRQPDHGDWGSVINVVAERLQQLSGRRLRDLQLKCKESDYPSHERLELENLLESKQQAALQHPECPDAHLDMGATLALLGRDGDAARSFRKVLELDADHVAGHLNLAYVLLALGDYREGWHHFEWRLRRLSPGQLPPWLMLEPNTLGSHPAGSTLLVHCEQGFGDTIQFARFLPMLVNAGFRVIVSCQPSVASLITTMKGVSVVVHGDPLPVCDVQVLLLSLPYLFSVTLENLPVSIPYLAPQSGAVDCWRIRLNTFFSSTKEKN